MFRSFKYGFVITLIFLTLAGVSARAALPTIMKEEDILPYLEQMISWHRQAAALETSPELPREMILKNTLQQHTAQALDGSFTFARALAEILPATPKPAVIEDKLENASKEIGINKAISLADLQTQQLQIALDHAKTRKMHDKLTGELKLAQEHLNLLREIAETIGVPDEEDNSLSHKIDQLAGTITEIDTEQQKPSGPETMTAQGSSATSTNGIVGLATKIYYFVQAKSTVKAMLNDTRSLANDNKDRTQIIKDALKGIMQEGTTLGDKPAAKSPPVAAPQPTYDDLVTQMKRLSKVAVALSQTNKALTLCTHDLSDWVDLISLHIKELLANLVFRLSMLALAISIAFGLSAVARKATRRYVIDRRRKDQLRVIRKVTLTVTIAVILFLGFFTDLSSLATFAGLITAGIAFAMKDMILSLIAYFQFFSSSDIHPGDSVTISGVTGKITQIGMQRFYMMETEKSDVGFLPTGRIVSFANNVLFQPTPFFRQTPGTNFVWNEIDISLAPDIDHELAYKKLNDVVQKIYAKQQENIRRSEVALQKMSPFKLDVSVPQTYFKFTNTGVVFSIRYAVERDQAQSLHLLMTTALITAIKKDPELKVMYLS